MPCHGVTVGVMKLEESVLKRKKKAKGVVQLLRKLKISYLKTVVN
jgi:hypothetical protein